MTLDKALEGLSGSEEDKKKVEAGDSQSNQSFNYPYELFTAAQELPGDFLANTLYQNGFDDKILSRGLQTSLNTIGPFVLNIQPAKDSGNYKVSLRNSIDRLTWNHYLKSLTLEDTDLAYGDEEIDFKKFPLPELIGIDSALSCDSADISYISPYILAMGMEPRFRSLIGISICEATENNELNESDSFDASERKAVLLTYIPSLKSIVETAKTYQIKQIRDAVADLDRVVKLYEKNW